MHVHEYRSEFAVATEGVRTSSPIWIDSPQDDLPNVNVSYSGIHAVSDIHKI